MCWNGKTPYLIKVNREDKRVTWLKADCDSWSCPECSHKLKRRHVARIAVGCDKAIAEGGELSFITLTAHRAWRGEKRSIENFRRNFPKLRKRLNRQAARNVRYVMIAEKHRDGSIHMHALYDYRPTKRWLKNAAAECGLGHQADVAFLDHGGHAIAYVTKYLTKAAAEVTFPKNFRRVRYSDNWLAKAYQPVGADGWEAYLDPRHAESETMFYAGLGYAIIHARDNELTDWQISQYQGQGE